MKKRKRIVYSDYENLVWKIALVYFDRLPPRARELYEAEDLVHLCMEKWSYIVSHYDERYAFTTLLARAVHNELSDFITKVWKENNNMPRYEYTPLDGERELNFLENMAGPPTHNIDAVNADRRFRQFWLLASPELKDFLRHYVLEGKFKHGNMTRKIAKHRPEVVRLAKRTQTTAADASMFYGVFAGR